MSNVSFFGFGGWDPLGSYGEAMMGQHFNRSAARYQARLNYKYAKKYALNSPTWTMRGYRAAGINPILAAQHGNLSVSDNPTNVQAPDLGDSTTGIDSVGLAHAPWSAIRRAERESQKQAEIKTESDQSSLEAQRARDMLEVLQNTAKINVLLQGLTTDDAGRPAAIVTKEGDTSKPWLTSPYGIMAKHGVYNPDVAHRNEWLLRKAYQDEVDLGSEKYIRETIPLVTQSAKDVGAAIGELLPLGKLGAFFKAFKTPTQHSGKTSGRSSRRPRHH